MPLDPDAYHRTLEAARRRTLILSEAQWQAFRRLLEEYAEELERRAIVGIELRGRDYAAEAARQLIAQLTRDMAQATRNGVERTVREVTSIYAQATNAFMAAAGERAAVAFTGLNVRAVQAVLARPELSAAFRSIRAESIEAVDRILRRALLRNVTSASIAMELRAHMLGADAFPARLLRDRRRIGYEAIRQLGYQPTRENLQLVRKQTGRIAARAQLIARTEPINAEHEAAVRSAAESPVVAVVRWNLSSRHTVRDQCDLLAETDWFGYGPGRYDPRQVPSKPHPRDLCFMTHEMREVRDWGRDRGPLRDLIIDPHDVGETFELYPSQIAALARSLQIGERRDRRAA